MVGSGVDNVLGHVAGMVLMQLCVMEVEEEQAKRRVVEMVFTTGWWTTMSRRSRNSEIDVVM